MTDPIADMLTRIRNAMMVRKNQVSLPYSRMKFTVAKVLADTGFIETVDVEDTTPQKTLHITINPTGSNARITEIQRVSKPGRRIYVKSKDISPVKSGRGIAVISTSRGVMTTDEAKKQKLGGELICEVY